MGSSTQIPWHPFSRLWAPRSDNRQLQCLEMCFPRFPSMRTGRKPTLCPPRGTTPKLPRGQAEPGTQPETLPLPFPYQFLLERHPE